jgi:hypothetical protein
MILALSKVEEERTLLDKEIHQWGDQLSNAYNTIDLCSIIVMNYCDTNSNHDGLKVKNFYKFDQ